MTEKRLGPAPGVRLIEVSVKRELTVLSFSNHLLFNCCDVENTAEKKKLLLKPVSITAKTSLPSSKQSTGIFCSSFSSKLKDVRANCYCASLVRTLFIRHARATSFSSVCTKSKTQQNIQLMTFTLTWCANIFVGCSVTSTFFSWSLPFVILSIMLKNKKKSVRGKF